MPTYEYECVKTGKHFERFQNMSDAPVKKCPECGGPARRLITGGGGVIFKGAGFYATESRASSGPACGRNARCCGRDAPCDAPPCDR